MIDFYHPDEWEGGLRCTNCMCEFVEGQPISELLLSMSYVGTDPAYVVEIVCVPCSMGAAVM